MGGVLDDADPSTRLDEPVVMALVQPLDGCRILDLGCGTGRYLGQWRTDGRVVGLDISAAMLRRARTRRRPCGVSWVQASAERLPFHRGAFDRVVCGLVVDHLSDLSRFFHETAAVLTVGGRAVVSAVHPKMQRLTGPIVTFTDGRQSRRIPAVIHEVEEMIQAAADAGLSLLQRREPCVSDDMVTCRPAWRSRLGCRALLILAFEKGS